MSLSWWFEAKLTFLEGSRPVHIPCPQVADEVTHLVDYCAPIFRRAMEAKRVSAECKISSEYKIVVKGDQC